MSDTNKKVEAAGEVKLRAEADGYRPDSFSLSNEEIRATGLIGQGAVQSIARELIALRVSNAKALQAHEATKRELDVARKLLATRVEASRLDECQKAIAQIQINSVDAYAASENRTHEYQERGAKALAQGDDLLVEVTKRSARMRLAFEGYIRDRLHTVDLSDFDVTGIIDEWLAVAEDVEDVDE